MKHITLELVNWLRQHSFQKSNRRFTSVFKTCFSCWFDFVPVEFYRKWLNHVTCSALWWPWWCCTYEHLTAALSDDDFSFMFACVWKVTPFPSRNVCFQVCDSTVVICSEGFISTGSCCQLLEMTKTTSHYKPACQWTPAWCNITVVLMHWNMSCTSTAAHLNLEDEDVYKVFQYL